ncbi:MAG TPA: FG-GAP-like repeat-containing protein, partial [Anaerolinea sp.]|nr:FG-GAP-like repeat-containing protein [Anaerolinea sp.]
MNALRRLLAILSLAALTAGCTPGVGASELEVGPTATPASKAAVTVTSLPLAQPAVCQNTYISHTLPFSTGYRMREISTYASNGAGLAINDLDGDGDLDIVFASVDRESVILWNQGGLKFKEESLDDRFTRGVSIVDV